MNRERAALISIGSFAAASLLELPPAAGCPPATGSPMPHHAGEEAGLGRLLIALYSLFALAAGARALFQIATKWSGAPLAYGLSALAALAYLLACIGLAGRTPSAWRLAAATCALELVGVLVVGGLSLARPALFPAPTVWSGFGAGYGFLPLLLPALGLAWLLRPATRRAYGIRAGGSPG